MKIAIVSDSHDNRRALVSALEDAKSRGAEAVIHCGDVVAPSTLGACEHVGLPMHVIHGNNAGDLVALSRRSHRPGTFYTYYGQDAGIELGGRKVFIVHYPHYGLGMAATGDWDLVCYGHDHRAVIETVPNVKGGTTQVVDPGSCAGLDGPATYVMGDLATMQFELLPVPGIEGHG